jgi:threonine dehydratase
MTALNEFKMFVHRLVEVEKAVVEGAGACGLAALLAGLLPELKGSSMNTLPDQCIINLLNILFKF